MRMENVRLMYGNAPLRLDPRVPGVSAYMSGMFLLTVTRSLREIFTTYSVKRRSGTS